jgi:hypothetical protein
LQRNLLLQYSLRQPRLQSVRSRQGSHSRIGD